MKRRILSWGDSRGEKRPLETVKWVGEGLRSVRGRVFVKEYTK